MDAPHTARRAARVAAIGILLAGATGVQLDRASPVAAQVSGLVAAYGFEDGSGPAALDASPSRLTGTISGAAWTTNGKFGSALNFDGIDDIVTIPHAAAISLSTGMTLEAWVRPTALTTWRTVIMKERPNALSYTLYASDAAARPSTIITVGTTERPATGTSTIALNTWTHLASTYDGTTLRTYVNGVQVAALSQTGPIAGSTNPLRLGGNAVWGEFFAGTIDEVRVYNRALSAAELQSDMATPVGPGQPPPPPPNAATVGRWSPPAELGMVAVTMVQLHTGKILMFRGMNDGGSSASVYDPLTGAKKSVPAPYNLFCSGHTQLADGRILVVGGHDNPNGLLGIARAVIFDPATETWTETPPMSQRRWYPSATTLPDGRVLVTSGATTSLSSTADIPEIYDPTTNSWTQLSAARLAFPWYPYSFVLPDGKVLIAGAGERRAPTRVLDMSLQQWTTIEPGLIDGGSAVMYSPGKVMKSGTGATTEEGNDPTATTTYVLDMTQPAPAWRQTAPMARPRAYHTLTPLPDGTVIATGGGVTTEGMDTSAAVYEPEIWSPATETWSTMSPMTVPRLYHSTGLLLPDGRVMVAGSGDSYGGPNQTTAEYFEPPYLFKGARPSVTGVPSVIPTGSTFAATVTGTIAKVSLEALGAVTHNFDENARHVELAFQQSGNQLSITAPANTNLAPPGYYMLFVVSTDGVPSVSTMVRIPRPNADVERPTAPTNVVATGGQSRVDLTWNASTDNVGVTGYEVHRSTSSGFAVSASTRIASTTSPSHADTGLLPGTYFYRVVARDAAGNSSQPSAEASATVTGDTTPPTVSVTAPTNGATVSGTIELTATASDAGGVSSVQFQVDGVNVGAADTIAPYSVSWNSATTANGAHTITATARDTAANQQTSSGVGVTVSNTGPPPTTGLVGAWSFDAGAGVAATDSSGAGNHGVVAGATWLAGGKFGGALSFDGVNDRVDIADSASLDLTTGMTLEAWVRPTSLTGWRTAVLKEQPSSHAYALYASDGTRPDAEVNTANVIRAAAGSAALPLNTWSHLAGTYDGATLRLYVNAVQVGSLPVTGPMPASSSPLRIGGNAVWGEWFAGAIDEVRVYNRALSAAELQGDMNTPVAPPAPADTVAPSAPGPVVATNGVGRVDLTWGAATDNVGVTAYSVHRSTVAGFAPSAANRIAEPTTTSYADTGLAVGDYYYVVTARDAAGNVGPGTTEVAGSSLADTTPPTVALTQPANAATVSGTTTVSATATDNVGVAGVQFRLDGVNLGAEDTTSPYQVSWNTTTATNGTHTLTAVARDAATNTATSTARTVTVSNAPPSPSGLVGAWSFNAGTGSLAQDSSTAANNGTISGATWTVGGRYGSALSFDGVNDRVDIPDSASLDLTNRMTIEAWVRPTTTSGRRTVVLKERSGGLVYSLYSSNRFGRPEVDMFLNNERDASGSSSLPLNQWSHLAATYNGTTLQIYVNGVSVGSRQQSGSMAATNNPLRIGGNAVSSEWFSGVIDEVRIYNRALTASEIQTDMNQPIT